MNMEQSQKPPEMDELLAKARQESTEKEFDPEAEKEKIYARANERRNKLFDFRAKAFAEAAKNYKGPTGIQGNIAYGPAEYEAFSEAHSRALDKTNFGKKKDEDAGLTDEEKAALLYQRKYNEIQRDMELEIASVEERVKTSSKIEQPKPEAPKVEEPKVEKMKPEDMEKMMSEI